jgi:cystathionine beta-lyase/cystathionine gamma-synthase
MGSDIKKQARTLTYRLRHLSENDLLLTLIYRQNKAIEKISSPQNEQRFSSVHEEAPNDQRLSRSDKSGSPQWF